MKKIQNLGRTLSKGEQRKISGGLEEDAAGCVGIYCLDNGYESCWYSKNKDIVGLCGRVYPNCTSCSGDSVPCDGCTMG